MVLLMLFALVAGAATALSPCVLPVLPAVLGAGVTGGRRRPLGVVTGLVLAFTFATIALVYVIDALGLPDDLVRTLAIVTLFAFGISLLIPGLGDRIEAFGSRIAPGPARVGGDGFGSGLLLGASLGLVYTPCAGPILAGVITVSAAQDFTAGKLAIALSYAVGSGAVLYLLMLGGRRLVNRIKPARAFVQTATGVVMVLVAVAMTADLDLKFQNAIADDLPAALVNPTGDLERSSAVSKRLDDLRGPSRFAARSGLPVLGPAPDFTGVTHWLNSGPLTLRQLRGKVVLIDFWTYTCINCLRTLPYVRAWDERYRDRGLVIVGVHTPEFGFEKGTANVRDSIARNHLRYPVAQDNDYGTWNAWGNQYWPAKYLVDTSGRVRYAHFGEGDYDKTEAAIRSLLPDRDLGARAGRQAGEVPGDATPETYLGVARAERWNPPLVPGTRDYPGATHALRTDQFALGGRWRLTDEAAEAVHDGTLQAHVRGKSVYLVLGSRGGPRRVTVVVDGRRERTITVRRQRLYTLLKRPRSGEHQLAVRFAPGVSGYAFTFG